MLIRWANNNDINRFKFYKEKFEEFEVLVAIDRRTENVLGIIGFSRDMKKIIRLDIFCLEKEEIIKEKLERCVNNQLNPKGKSFHYNYPRYNYRLLEENCPVCNAEPMPEEMEDLAIFEHSWVIAELKAQGKLFGKCVVGSHYHNVHFYDLPEDEMIHFIKDVQKVAKALHKVTGAVKINYEIHGNSGPHLHCHLFPRYLDDDFPSAPIDYRITEPNPYEDLDEYKWFIDEMRKELGVK